MNAVDAGSAAERTPSGIIAVRACGVHAAERACAGGDVAAAEAALAAVPPDTRDAAWHATSGQVLGAAEDHAAAARAFAQAHALGDTSRLTRLNLAVALDRAGDAQTAMAQLDALCAECPDWDEALLRHAECLRRQGDLAAAERGYEAVLELNPQRVEALLSLAVVLLQQDTTGAAAVRAQMLLLRCCSLAPDHAPAWDTLGMTLLQTGDAAAATAAFAEAVRLDPDNADIALRTVKAHMRAGTGEAELTRIEVASAADPLNTTLLMARGALLGDLGRHDDAIETLEIALTLDPTLADAASARAHLLVRANRVGEAIPALEQAIALRPEDITLRNNHAAALLRVHRYAEARTELEALLDAHGDKPGMLCNLTNTLISLGLHDEGVALAWRAIDAGGDPNLAWRTLCNALPYIADLDPTKLLLALRQASATARRGKPFTPPAGSDRAADPARRLRIGLLSNSLRVHPVGWFTVAAFENLDPRAFEIVCVGRQHPGDPLARRFSAIAADWVVVDKPDLDAAVERIRGLNLDIVIDLGGYGDQGMMPLCASRLAPLQVKWVGSQNHSTGLAEMDGFITDRWETPPELAPLYTEQLLVLPDGYVCYSPPTYAPDVDALPALRNGAITFGCFNNMAKITGAVIAAWSDVLARVPGSRLMLKCHQMADPATRARVCAGFVAHGIDPARILPRGSSPHRVLLAEYNEVDIVLDPFPYNGGLTTCEALWMGVPTITMPGQTFASRHSTSHLSNVGLTDWIATGPEAYVGLAVRKSSDLDALAALRAGLRSRVARSPLCDGARFGRHLGAALHAAWAETRGSHTDAQAA
jgi:predicted O-linked N-acetylglucosamine transferase (SPINDLY family)